MLRNNEAPCDSSLSPLAPSFMYYQNPFLGIYVSSTDGTTQAQSTLTGAMDLPEHLLFHILEGKLTMAMIYG